MVQISMEWSDEWVVIRIAPVYKTNAYHSTIALLARSGLLPMVRDILYPHIPVYRYTYGYMAYYERPRFPGYLFINVDPGSSVEFFAGLRKFRLTRHVRILNEITEAATYKILRRKEKSPEGEEIIKIYPEVKLVEGWEPVTLSTEDVLKAVYTPKELGPEFIDPGTPVKITGGPAKGFWGILDKISKEKAVVKVFMMGKDVDVEVDPKYVEELYPRRRR